MQKRLLFFACLLLAICNKMAAADQIVISDFSIYPGNRLDVDVVLTNTDSSVGFQFDLYLPEGIVLDGYIGSNRLPEGTSLQMRQQDDGGYRFVAASMERNTIIGNDGAVITLILQATANAVPGSYTGYLRAAKVSKADGTGSTINELPFTVTVEANTAEPYAVLSEDGLTVTFYYDDQKASRGGMEINNNFIDSYNGEKNPYGTAVTAIIDDSFANYTTLRSTAYWFMECNNLTEIRGIANLKTANVTYMSLMFDGCSGLTSLDVSGFNTANVTDMHYMFSGCSGLTSLDVSGFNTANVTNMYSMFSYCSGLTSLDVSGFNTANVTNMVSMFSGCSGLTSLDVSGFNTANVMYMHQMFELCSGLTSLDVSGFNTANVTDMGSMFELCSGLTSLDVSGFNTANVTYMSKMFENCSSLRTIYVSDSWNTSAVTFGGNMFVDCISLVGGAGTAYDANHTDHTYAHIDGGTQNPGYFTDKNAPVVVDKPSAPEFAFEGDNLVMTTQTEGASIFYAMADLPSTDDEAVVDSVTNSFTVKIGVDDGNYYYEQPFELKKSVVLKAIAVGNGTNGQEAVSDTTVLVYDYEAWVNLLQAVVYGSDVLDRSQGNSKVDQNLVEELKWMLDECSMIYSHRATMPYFEAKHFTNQILALCEQIESQLSQGGTPEPYAVLSDSNTVLTFYNDDQKAARNGMSVGPFDGNPDYQAWYDQRESITSVVFDASFANCTTITSTAYWFYGCEKLTTITGISNLKTGNVTDMGCMFYGCANLASLDVSHFDTSLVEGMYFMFANCSKLTNLDLSNFNTSNVKKMHFMFRDCSALQSIALSNFNTSNVIWMHLMFDGCSNLTSLDVSNFDTSNVTEIEAMFRGCSNLTSLDVSHFNTSKAKYMGAMFNDCRKLKSIDVSHFDTSNAESMLQMFAGCYSLTSLDVSNFNTAKVTNMKNMFSGCSNLVDINMSNFNTDNVTDMTDIFANCTSLASIQAGSAMIPANEYAKVENPNLLVYVNNEQYAPENIQNVVIGDFAKNIVLTDVGEGNGNFYCPQEFKAETITYSHEYNQTTEIDVARGWESIALPFAVQTITHETKGQIAPFGSTASGKHFWLRQLTENGLARATEIEPNTAYLISMPNNDAYYADFNLNGLVTFSSVDVWVPKTQIHAVDYHTEKGMVVLLPNFQRRASDYTTYALNVGEQRGDYPEGSVFEREYRDIRPFEAYTFHQGGSAPRFLPISDLNGDDATGIEEVRSLRAEGRGDVWYDMSGRRLQQKPAGKGVYILNGRKVVIK